VYSFVAVAPARDGQGNVIQSVGLKYFLILLPQWVEGITCPFFPFFTGEIIFSLKKN
jgi:hypothetical protein